MIELSRHARLRLVMIGPMPPPFGGTTVSFNNLCRFLEPRVADCHVIDTVQRDGGACLTALKAILNLVRKIRHSDVVIFHFSDGGSISIGPILWFVCRLFRVPCAFRQFGGQFHYTFEALPKWHRWLLIRTIFRSDAIFLQTKEMVSAFGSFSKKIYWFPTARSKIMRAYKGRFAEKRGAELRCLFFGHVSKDKGVLRAVQAVSEVRGATLDIYGPLIDIDEAEILGPRVRYCGVVSPDQAGAIMAEYDVMLFPTMHRGEGYSGALVEATMVGLPIIASRWQALPEMFNEDEVFFVEPGITSELVIALRQIISHPKHLSTRSERLSRRAEDFSAEHVFSRFLDVCTNLAESDKS